jgi:hypothetical protein
MAGEEEKTIIVAGDPGKDHIIYFDKEDRLENTSVYAFKGMEHFRLLQRRGGIEQQMHLVHQVLGAIWRRKASLAQARVDQEEEERKTIETSRPGGAKTRRDPCSAVGPVDPLVGDCNGPSAELPNGEGTTYILVPDDRYEYFHLSQLEAHRPRRKHPGGDPCGTEEQAKPVVRVKGFLGFSPTLTNHRNVILDTEEAEADETLTYKTCSLSDIGIAGQITTGSGAAADPVLVPPEIAEALKHTTGLIIHDSVAISESENAGDTGADGRGASPVCILLKKSTTAVGLHKDPGIAKYLEKNKHNLVIVTNLHILRESGAKISHSLSWETTFRDIVWQIEHNHALDYLKHCAALVVRIGFAGAFVYIPRHDREPERSATDTEDASSEGGTSSNGGSTSESVGPRVAMCYDSCSLEGFFEERHPGEILAPTSLFIAVLFAELFDEIGETGVSSLQDFIDAGGDAFMKCCQSGIAYATRTLQYLHKKGYERGAELPGAVYDLYKEYDGDTGFPLRRPQNLAVIDSGKEALETFIERIGRNDPASMWSILDEKRTENIGAMAYTYVRCGSFSKRNRDEGSCPAAPRIPVFPFYRMGGIRSVYRGEIEGYQSIRKLIREYLETPSITTPLSVAVFGPPGSGKTFGIVQIASEFSDRDVKPLTFNLSQFTDTKELRVAFQRVRDCALEGKVPLVFFDEFDSPFDNHDLGWLKHFLVPMQEGTFIDGECLHPIGRAILIFAGGRFETFEAFNDLRNDAPTFETTCGGGEGTGTLRRDFRADKGPDFLSRLRGSINIVGCDPTGGNAQYMLTRAILLRTFLWNRAPDLFENNLCNIDRSVLRAFIKVGKYYHGLRSMQAIVEMSNLKGKKRFEPSALPPLHQLAMHVDADQFMRLVLRDVHYHEAKEQIVEQIKTIDTSSLCWLLMPHPMSLTHKGEKIYDWMFDDAGGGNEDEHREQFFYHIPAIFSVVKLCVLKEPGYSVEKITAGDVNKIDADRFKELLREIRVDKDAWPEADKDAVVTFFTTDEHRQLDDIIRDLKALQWVLARSQFKLQRI